MFSPFAIRTKEEIEQETETKKKIEKARIDALYSELKEIDKNQCFPGEIPNVGQNVRVVYKNDFQTPIILEGIVMCRSCRNLKQRYDVRVSKLMLKNRIGTQDFLLVIYDKNSETWMTEDGSPAVLTVLV